MSLFDTTLVGTVTSTGSVTDGVMGRFDRLSDRHAL